MTTRTRFILGVVSTACLAFGSVALLILGAFIGLRGERARAAQDGPPAMAGQPVPGHAPAAQTASQPAADRHGSRCFNGRYWQDCPPAEQPAATPNTVHIWRLPNTTQMWVAETEGVCLYIGMSVEGGIGAITAVPKTQLRPGVGCQ